MNVEKLSSEIFAEVQKANPALVGLRIDGEGYFPGEVGDVSSGTEPWAMVIETGLRTMTVRTLDIYLADRENEAQVQLCHGSAYYELKEVEVRRDDDQAIVILVAGGVISC